LQTRGDVDAVAHEVAVLFDDVADVEAKPVFKRERLPISAACRGGNFLSGFERLDSAWKLDKAAVADPLEYAPAVARYDGIDDGIAVAANPFQGQSFISRDQGAIPDRVET
jgi:hypothetical protein